MGNVGLFAQEQARNGDSGNVEVVRVALAQEQARNGDFKGIHTWGIIPLWSFNDAPLPNRHALQLGQEPTRLAAWSVLKANNIDFQITNNIDFQITQTLPKEVIEAMLKLLEDEKSHTKDELDKERVTHSALCVDSNLNPTLGKFDECVKILNELVRKMPNPDPDPYQIYPNFTPSLN